VGYTAQTGDTLTALAARFNTTEKEIREANPIIPQDATTLPPGLPMNIPIYYAPFWGSPYPILPDNLLVYGPSQRGFDAADFMANRLGWLKGVVEYASGKNRTGPELITLVAQNFSVSPRLLLALLEYRSGAVSLAAPPEAGTAYAMGYKNSEYKGVYLQLVWAANALNNGYYGWRRGTLLTIPLSNGRIERIDPWQNAATAALHAYFSHIMDAAAYAAAIAPDGFAKTYAGLFGDPWAQAQAHIPGSLQQPELRIPFEAGKIWSYTGGPHTGWGTGEPLAAIDFAPPSVVGGCAPTKEWATAVASGIVARTDTGVIMLDLDLPDAPADGDERTGWVVFYLHLAAEGRAALGARLNAGDPIGHPSCEGGSSTGTHIHLARKYNGEWIPADGALAWNLGGWIAQNGEQPYQGYLRRHGVTITACECSNQASQIQADPLP
jgi:murein DD-endopeptidase MepM/ murein hydrolase activator NlpD